MNTAKKVSDTDGKLFLQKAFESEQKILLMNLEHSSTSITHDGVLGSVNEQHLIDYLRKYLPKRYEVDSGIVIDSNGNTSDQIDAVIYDHQYTPTLLDQKSHRYIPVEAVYAVIEAKPAINKTYLEYASEKAASVRRLYRTSIPIPHAGGEFPAKSLFPILSSIVATRVEWKEGLCATSFPEILSYLTGDKAVDCGIGLSDRSFDTHSGRLFVSDPEYSLVCYTFRLLQKLQSLGTVPAIDWAKYASVFSGQQDR